MASIPITIEIKGNYIQLDGGSTNKFHLVSRSSFRVRKFSNDPVYWFLSIDEHDGYLFEGISYNDITVVGEAVTSPEEFETYIYDNTGFNIPQAGGGSFDNSTNESRLDALESRRDFELQILTEPYVVGDAFRHTDGNNYVTITDAAAGETPDTHPAKFKQVDAPAGGDMTGSNNLSEITDPAAARTVLQLNNVPNVDATSRANHTGTQTASTISDFDTEVSNNADVIANTAKVSFPEAPNDGKQYARESEAWAEVKRDLITASTGLREFGGISINGVDNTKFDLGIIKGQIIDNITDPDNPTVTEIDQIAQTVLTPLFIATNPVTYIGWSASGLEQRNVPFTEAERRAIIPLGVIVHSNNVIINTFNDLPLISLSPLQQLVDIVEKIGIFNGAGNIFSGTAGTYQINKSIGQFVKMGVNYINDAASPNVKTLPALTNATFRYRNQDSSEGLDITAIDPNTYDVGGVTTAVPNNRWHVQRVTVFSSNIVRVQRAQNHYANRNAAIRNINVDPFVTEPNIQQNGLVRCYIVMQEGAANLDNATFIEAAKFQNAGGGGTSGSVWSPPPLALGSGIANGSTLTLSAGAGFYVNFAQGADNEWVMNVGLNSNGLEYDGTPITIEFEWMKFGIGVGTVNWEIDYAFVNLGDDAYSISDGTLVESVDVSLLANQVLTTTSFTPISGNPGDRHLQLTFRRNSIGGGSDTYSGEAELYGINSK